jgi:TRAP-type transport system periplasmic protein
MKRMSYVCVVVFIVLMALSFLPLSGTAAADEIKMFWASFLPKNIPETSDFQTLFVDKVNERAKGKLNIGYRGGPEAIPPTDLGDATAKGIIDMCTTTVGWYEAIVPGVGALMLSDYTPQAERANTALLDYTKKLHADHGLYWLGRSAPTKDNFFYIFLNKKVEKPEDFKKMKLGVATAARATAEAWGATVTPVKISDYFTAMERKLVDGIPGCPIVTWVSLGCQEVTKYVLDYQFYQSTATALMNLKSWNKLPDDVKKIMYDTMGEFYVARMDVEAKREEGARKKMKDARIEFYKFADPKDGQWLIKTADDAGWKYQHDRFPEVTDQLEKFLRRK